MWLSSFLGLIFTSVSFLLFLHFVFSFSYLKRHSQLPLPLCSLFRILAAFLTTLSLNHHHLLSEFVFIICPKVLSCRSALASSYQVQEHQGNMFLLHLPWHVTEAVSLSLFFPGTKHNLLQRLWLFPLPLCIKVCLQFCFQAFFIIYIYI